MVPDLVHRIEITSKMLDPDLSGQQAALVPALTRKLSILASDCSGYISLR